MTKGRRTDAEIANSLGISLEEYRMKRMTEKLDRFANMRNNRAGEAQIVVNACEQALKEQKSREALLRNTIDNSSEMATICQEFAQKLVKCDLDLEIALNLVRKKYITMYEKK